METDGRGLAKGLEAQQRCGLILLRRRSSRIHARSDCPVLDRIQHSRPVDGSLKKFDHQGKHAFVMR